jgi:tetratricopeptide (TPR) repeat protein
MRGKKKKLTLDTISADWINSCNDQGQLQEASQLLSTNASLANLRRAAEERRRFLGAHFDEEAEKEAEECKLRGNTCFRYQNYEDAISEYTESIRLNPANYESYTNRALAFLKLGNYPNALDDANVAIGLNANHIKAYQRRVEACLVLKDYARAYVTLRAILMMDPEYQNVKLVWTWTRPNHFWRERSNSCRSTK